jgi:hypothetical protein
VAASAIRIDGNIESHVRRVIRGDDAAGAVGQYGLVEALLDLVLIPTVVHLFYRQGIEPAGRIGQRAATLERLMTEKPTRHAPTLRGAAAVVNPVFEQAYYCMDRGLGSLLPLLV